MVFTPAALTDLERIALKQTLPIGSVQNDLRKRNRPIGGEADADKAGTPADDERGGERGTPRFYNISLNYDATGFSGVTINSQENICLLYTSPSPRD